MAQDGLLPMRILQHRGFCRVAASLVKWVEGRYIPESHHICGHRLQKNKWLHCKLERGQKTDTQVLIWPSRQINEKCCIELLGCCLSLFQRLISSWKIRVAKLYSGITRGSLEASSTLLLSLHFSWRIRKIKLKLKLVWEMPRMQFQWEYCCLQYCSYAFTSENLTAGTT